MNVAGKAERNGDIVNAGNGVEPRPCPTVFV